MEKKTYNFDYFLPSNIILFFTALLVASMLFQISITFVGAIIGIIFALFAKPFEHIKWVKNISFIFVCNILFILAIPTFITILSKLFPYDIKFQKMLYIVMFPYLIFDNEFYKFLDRLNVWLWG